MRPISLSVSGGQVVLIPASSAPLGARNLSVGAAVSPSLDRIACSTTALSILRRDWRDWYGGADIEGASDGRLLRLLSAEVHQRNLLVCWVPTAGAQIGQCSILAPDRARNPDVSLWTFQEKIAAALKVAMSSEVLDEQGRQILEELLSPTNLAFTVACFAALAAANAAGLGVAADLLLVGIAWISTGYMGVKALWKIASTTIALAQAISEADIQQAGRGYATGLRTLGTAFLSAFLLRARPASTAGRTSEAESVAARDVYRKQSKSRASSPSSSKRMTPAQEVVSAYDELPPLRKQYVESVNLLQKKAQKMRLDGASAEEIARTVHADRRTLGVQYKELTPPEKLTEIYARNKRLYGDKLGPSIEWLRGKGKSWEQIIESASRTGGKDLGF